MSERIRFQNLDKADFVSDADRWALEKLKKVPLLPQAVSKFYEVGLDRWMYLLNMGYAVRCGPKQFPSLHKILLDCCAIMDMPEVELYVTNNPFPNAFAGGVERPYITLRSSIIDTMSDEQLYHLIGHELGHIKAEHVLYFSIASLILPILDLLGKRTLGVTDVATYGLLLALFEWSRQAEFSADRAGLLCSQNYETSQDANMALAAGPSRLRHEMSREAFLEQAGMYQEAPVMDQLGKAIVFALIGKTMTHPMPIHRAQALARWKGSGDYDRLLQKFQPVTV